MTIIVNRKASAVAVKSAAFRPTNRYAAWLTIIFYNTAGQRTIIQPNTLIVLSELAVFSISDVDIGVYNFSVFHSNHTAATGVDIHLILGHQITGEDLNGIFFRTLTQQGTFHIQNGDTVVCIIILGIGCPELNLGTGQNGQRSACCNLQTTGDNVILFRIQRGVRFNSFFQHLAFAHFQEDGIRKDRCIKFLIRFIQCIFAGHRYMQCDDVIVGTVFIDLQQKRRFFQLCLTVTGGIGADLTIIDGGLKDRHIRIFIGTVRPDVNGHLGICALTPTVAKCKGQCNGLACINDAVFAVFFIQIGSIADVPVIDRHFRRRHLCKRCIQIHDFGKIVEIATHCVFFRIYADC